MKAFLTGARYEESKQKGTPGVNFKFTDEQGVHHYAHLWLTEKTIKNSENVMTNVLGWNGSEDFSAEDTFNWGCEVDLVINEETYEGATRSVVKFINSPDGARFSKNTPMTSTSKSAFDLLKAQRLSNKKTTNKKSDEDVGF